MRQHSRTKEGGAVCNESPAVAVKGAVCREGAATADNAAYAAFAPEGSVLAVALVLALFPACACFFFFFSKYSVC